MAMERGNFCWCFKSNGVSVDKLWKPWFILTNTYSDQDFGSSSITFEFLKSYHSLNCSVTRNLVCSGVEAEVFVHQEVELTNLRFFMAHFWLSKWGHSIKPNGSECCLCRLMMDYNYEDDLGSCLRFIYHYTIQPYLDIFVQHKFGVWDGPGSRSFFKRDSRIGSSFFISLHYWFISF